MKKLRAIQLSADFYWKNAFHGGCGRYDGPALAWKVVACKAPDGSYWAVQSWQRKLPNYGLGSAPSNSAWEVHLSHWTGSLPVLTVNTDWSWHQWNHLYGTFTYNGVPVFGFARPRRASRSTASAGTCTSTHWTPRTARAGSARTASSPTRATACSATASTRTRAIPPDGSRVPRDDHGPRRHARRDVAGPGPRRLRPGDRRPAQPCDLGPQRHALSSELIELSPRCKRRFALG